jgi:hypothetical protein
MAKCDLCDAQCKSSKLVQLREPYQVPGVVDLCPACRKWADGTKDALMSQIAPQMRTLVQARKHGGAPLGFWANFWDGMGFGALWRWLARKKEAGNG